MEPAPSARSTAHAGQFTRCYWSALGSRLDSVRLGTDSVLLNCQAESQTVCQAVCLDGVRPPEIGKANLIWKSWIINWINSINRERCPSRNASLAALKFLNKLSMLLLQLFSISVSLWIALVTFDLVPEFRGLSHCYSMHLPGGPGVYERVANTREVN